MKNTGGAAFPRPASQDACFDARVPSQTGMTLRDYFAAASINAAVVKAIHNYALNGVKLPYIGWQEMAESAYCMADAMLTERDKCN